MPLAAFMERGSRSAGKIWWLTKLCRMKLVLTLNADAILQPLRNMCARYMVVRKKK